MDSDELINLLQILEMLDRYCSKIIHGLIFLGSFEEIPSRTTEPPLPPELVLEASRLLTELEKVLISLDMKTSMSLCQSAIKSLEFVQYGDWKSAIDDFRTLRQAIRAEISSYNFYYVPASAAEYYGKNQFSKEVLDSFPDDYDMLEAGKSFALGLYTACACHLMRVAELGLQRIEREYGFKPLRSWGDFLRNLREYAQRFHDTDRPKKESIMELYARVAAMKDAWRDDTMHVVRKYDGSEAKEVFDSVKNFMNLVSLQLP